MPGMTTNQNLHERVDSWAEVLTPDSIYWCDGTEEEYDRFTNSMVEQGTLLPLNDAKRPNSFLADLTQATSRESKIEPLSAQKIPLMLRQQQLA